MSQITTVIFDIGNVMVDFDWKTYLNRMVSDPLSVRVLEQAVFLSRQWVEHDKGLLLEGEEEILDFVANAPAYEKEIRALYASLGGCIRRREYAVPWVQELKAEGYRVYACSNMPWHILHQGRDKMDFLDQMDGAFLSCEEHLIKPDPKAYLRLTEKFQICPETSVFLDDTVVNIEVARKLGFHGILFQNREQALRELEKLGVHSTGQIGKNESKVLL